jgi:hypothetical protein
MSSPDRPGSPRAVTKYGYNSGIILGSSGHLRVTVNESKATVEYVRAFLPKDKNEKQKNGQIGYSYEIPLRTTPRDVTR